MTKQFAKWASKKDVGIKELQDAMNELKDGNYEASLGGYLFKKRIAFKGKGKSGSARTIVCYKKGERAFCVFGYSKNEKDNLTPTELKAFQEHAKLLLSYTAEEISDLINKGVFKEI